MRRASPFRYYYAFAFPLVLWTVWSSLSSILVVSSVDLPWNDINIVAVTDVHSWVAGHAPHPHWSNDNPAQTPDNADYGHVLSFYRHLQQQAAEQNVDLFFVMNGDFMDGTGLSTIPPDHLLPLLTCMPWDAVNLGNHELYHNETVAYMMDSGFIDHWHGNYLTSNVDVLDTSRTRQHQQHHLHYRPLGNRYTYLYGTYTNTTILTFGFLYNFVGNCHRTRVRKVEQVVQEAWFQSVLEQDNFQAIMVLAHMDYRDDLVTVILQAIRKIVGMDMPVQFINGHSHVRGVQTLDENAVSFEPGHFLDTIGFASFSVPATRPMMAAGAANQNQSTLSCLFQHVFLDANVKELQETAHRRSLSTPEGDALSDFIHETETALGLTDIIGCSQSTFYLQNALTDQKSLWRLFLRKVVPTQLFQLNASKVYIENTGAFRFNLFAGKVTLNDLIAVAPFQDAIYQVAERVSGRELNQLMEALNAGSGTDAGWPHMVSSAEGIESDLLYDIFTADFDTRVIGDKIETIASWKQVFLPLLNERNESITTTLLWADFVRAEFPCRTGWADLYFSWIVAGFIVCVVLFCAWWFLPQHLERRRLDKPPEQQDQCPILDGNGGKIQSYDAI
jgi:2',3'-cyclic-nucleotide 2'-phosphodiesterase (5'-nucleotidase family)